MSDIQQQEEVAAEPVEEDRTVTDLTAGAVALEEIAAGDGPFAEEAAAMRGRLLEMVREAVEGA